MFLQVRVSVKPGCIIEIRHGRSPGCGPAGSSFGSRGCGRRSRRPGRARLLPEPAAPGSAGASPSPPPREGEAPAEPAPPARQEPRPPRSGRIRDRSPHGHSCLPGARPLQSNLIFICLAPWRHHCFPKCNPAPSNPAYGFLVAGSGPRCRRRCNLLLRVRLPEPASGRRLPRHKRPEPA